ncbi:MAG: class I SAM-dependent methyltransferase [Acidobacteria bacterium]|nr:class I SAM-dependent methyltransferase [Acidobacteriota bacterium]
MAASRTIVDDGRDRPEYGRYAGRRFIAGLLVIGGVGVILFVLGLGAEARIRAMLLIPGAVICVVFLWPGVGLLLSDFASKHGSPLRFDFLDRTGSLRVLDCGCGTGRHAIPLARQLGPGSILTGLDVFDQEKISNNAVERVCRNARIEGVEDRTRFLVGSVTAIPFPSESFDVVTCMAVLHTLGNGLDAALAEMHRVLRPDGLLFLYELDRVANLPTSGLLALVLFRRASFWRTAIERHGFHIEHMRRDGHRIVFHARPTGEARYRLNAREDVPTQPDLHGVSFR